MKRCFIYSAGSYYEGLERPTAEDYIIAADAGLKLCDALRVTPDLVLGDFDSMEEPLHLDNRIKVPVEKDDTDTMLAIRKGFEQGCTLFYIYGGTGGQRADHTLANIQALAFIKRRGGTGILYDKHFMYTVIENERLEIPRYVDDGLVSLFALSDKAEHLNSTGLYYPLHDLTLSSDYPMGVSNHITADTAAISCGPGLLLVSIQIDEL